MKSFKLIVIWIIAGLLFFMMATLAVLEPENEELKNIAIDMINKESQYKKFKLNSGENKKI